MEPAKTINRPALDEALDAWKKILAEHKFATNIIWLFEENLCFEKLKTEEGGFHVGFQTKFTPPPEDALEIAYDHFCETDAPIVFYRLGDVPDRSVCALLCDQWFEKKGCSEGFARRDDWNIFFHAGHDDNIEEITDLSRWVHRVKRGRPFHDLDFCMSLAMVDEIKIYGRPLVPYERYAESMLERMRRMLGNAGA
ncbi:MAG TPA: hypothetical protein VFV23_11015 [Verrucomicrobiae bacterium]|nr:hypothetical protein [Verrucomicrobiae bacterium]